MASKNKITPFQFYTVLYLGRIFSFVTYIANIHSEISSTETLIIMLLTGVYMMITSIPTLVLLNNRSEVSIIKRAEYISKPLSKIFCVLFILDYFFYGIITAARFEIFTSSVMFPETDMSFLVLTLLAACAYAAFKGIEGIGRAGVLFLIPVVISFVFVYLSLIKDFDTLNFTPITSFDTKELFKSSLYSCAATPEIISIGILLPFVKNHKKRHLPIWITVLTATLFISDLMLTGVLGSFGNTQLFGMYSLSVLAQWGFVERLDAVITCVWMLCAVARLSLIFFISDYLFTLLFGKKNDIVYLVITVAVVFAGMLVISNNILTFFNTVLSAVEPAVYLVSSIVPQIIVLIAEKRKDREVK